MSRILAVLDARGFLPWMLPGFHATLKFLQWRRTRTSPNVDADEEEKDPDLIAELRQLQDSGALWLLLIEWQTLVDPDMFSRLLIELGQLHKSHRPEQADAGDRFQLCAAVINLTGTKQSTPASNQFVLPGTIAMECTLKVREIHLAEESASQTMDRIEAKEIGQVILGLIPLMKDGGEDAILQRWREMQAKVENPRWRATITTAALVFSELKDWNDKWDSMIKGDTQMLESVNVNNWLKEGRTEGLKEGRTEGLKEGRTEGRKEGVVEGLQTTLREWLVEKFMTISPVVEARIKATTDPAVLRKALRQVDTLAKAEDVLS
jgi:hypothetical protein